MTNQVEDWIPTRQTLLSRLKDWDDRSSWEDFFQTYWKLIYNVALRSGLREAEAQDVVQETIISVAKQMPTFRYDPSKGSFKGWLLKTTQWRVGDQFRKRREMASLDAELKDEMENERGSGKDNPLVIVESAWEELWHQNAAAVAVERVQHHADGREFQIFDLVVNHGWEPAKIARKLGVSRAHVYYARHKIARLIRKEMERLEKQSS